jgi:hypothetical protein
MEVFMRLLIASMMVCCCAVAGYSNETADASPEAPAEITSTDDAGDQVAVGTEANKDKPATGGCGCGKGNKPKI